MSKNKFASKLFAAAVLITAPTLLHPSHAHADSVSRSISNGECSSRAECEESDGNGIVALVGVVAVGFGFLLAAAKIAEVNDPRRKKAKAESPEAYKRYLEVVERAGRIRAVREKRLQAEREQNLRNELEQRNSRYAAEQARNAEKARLAIIEGADARIKQQRMQRIKKAPGVRKGNGAQP